MSKRNDELTNYLQKKFQSLTNEKDLELFNKLLTRQVLEKEDNKKDSDILFQKLQLRQLKELELLKRLRVIQFKNNETNSENQEELLREQRQFAVKLVKLQESQDEKKYELKAIREEMLDLKHQREQLKLKDEILVKRLNQCASVENKSTEEYEKMLKMSLDLLQNLSNELKN